MRNRVMLLGMLSTSLMANTFVFGQGGDASTLDPGKLEEAFSINISRQIQRNLVTYDKKGDIVPDIAESWKFSKDGKTITFHLKKNLKFNKTSYWNVDDDLTADDIVFSFKRQYDTGSKFYKRDHGHFSYWNGIGFDKVFRDIKKVDENTVEIKLSKKIVPFMSFLTMEFLGIVSKDYAESLYKKNKYITDYGRYPVGNGAFVLEKWKKDSYIILRSGKESYIKPKVDKIVFRTIKDNQTRLLALEAGDIDAMNGVNTEDLPELQNSNKMDVVYKVYPTTSYITFNSKEKPFNDARVRKAIAMAIDQDSILKSVFGLNSEKAQSIYPKGMLGWKDLGYIKRDIKKAKELLSEAGYPNGFKSELFYMPVPRSYMPNAKKAAQIIQADLKEAGIEVKLITYDWGTYLKKVKSGEYKMAIAGWSADIPDPDNFVYTLLNSKLADKVPTNNYSFFKNREFDKLVESAREEENTKKRAALYAKSLKILRDELPLYPIAHSKMVYVKSKKVKNITVIATGSFDFASVEVAKN